MLRDYQSAAIAALREGIRQGKRRQLLVSPTGSGKTVIAGEIIRRAVAKGSRVVALAHRMELIQQLSERMTREGVDHGCLIGKNTHGESKPVLVASVQTLARRGTRPPADLILLDEGHHAAAASYRKIIDAYPKAVLLALTASPWRQDGKGLSDVYDGSVLAATPAELIAQGHLCRYAGYAFMAPDLAAVRTVAGEFDEGQVANAYTQSRVFADVVEQWLARANGMRTVLFAASIENSLDLVARFRAAGITAEHVDYRTCDSDRYEILRRAKSGETTVTCNVGLLTEGVDVPEWKCCVMARPTQSLALYLQMVGRVMRPVGDAVAKIHDHAENVQRHGLPDAPRDYSLTASRPPRPPPLKQCKQCLAQFADWTQDGLCPLCRAPRPVVVRDAEGPEQHDDHVAVALEDVARLPSRAKQVAAFEEMMAEARTYGRRPGAALHRFKERFPGAPLPWGVWRRLVGKDKQWALPVGLA
jgi:DNA repair protein RadD